MTESKGFHPTVVAGAEWLDANGPADWPDRVDIETLNMWDGDRCVLGQVFADPAEFPRSHEFETGFGYAVMQLPTSPIYPFTPGELSADPLRDEWVRYIEHRRSVVAA